MKIGVISDTHGSLYFFEKAMHLLSDCELILHAGDILHHGRQQAEGGFSPMNLSLTLESMDHIVFARGNCDSSLDQNALSHPLHFPYILLEKSNHRILLCHGHHAAGRDDLIRQAKKLSATILIYGHTHAKELSRSDQLIILNPGSTTLPRDGIHSAAIIQPNRIALIDIQTGKQLQSMQLSVE